MSARVADIVRITRITVPRKEKVLILFLFNLNYKFKKDPLTRITFLFIMDASVLIEDLVRALVMFAVNIAMTTTPVKIQMTAKVRAQTDFGALSP